MSEEVGNNSISQHISIQRNILVPLLQFLTLSVAIWVSLWNRTLIYDSDATVEFSIYVGTLLILPFLTFVLYKMNLRFHIYSLAAEIFLYSLLILILLKDMALIPLTAVALVASILKVDRGPALKWDNIKIIIFISFSFIMYFLGGLMQFIIQPALAPISIAPLKDVFIYPGQSFPFLFDLGMNIYGSVVTLSLSPFTLIIFSLISALVAENYEGFIVALRRSGKGGIRSALYGVTAALSCQCEACISILPAMIFLIVTTAMVPLIMESLLLLVMSNILIRLYLSGRVPSFFGRAEKYYVKNEKFLASALVLIATPVELTGIYLGWLGIPVFFFGMGMLDVLAGYTLLHSLSGYLKVRRSVSASWAALVSGLILSFVWYYPPLTLAAFNSGAVFSVMAISGLAAGVLFGFSHLSLRKGYVMPETVSLIYGIFVIAIFYLSIDFRLNLWPEFPYSQTVIFEVISWAIMLPVMWIFTQLAIISASAEEVPFFQFRVNSPDSKFS